MLRGQGELGIGHERVPLCRGSLIWLPPGVDHVLEEASDDFDLLVVGFQRELLDAFEREHRTAPGFARRPEALDTALGGRLAEVLHAASVTQNDASAEHDLLTVLAKLQRLPNAQISPFQRAAELLSSNLDAGRDVLAQRVGINRGDLSRGFRRSHAMTISEYKNRLRLLKFLQRMADSGTHANMLRAALDAGFGSYSQCHRVFRTVIGASPRDYLSLHVRDSLKDRFEPLPSSVSRVRGPAFTSG